MAAFSLTCAHIPLPVFRWTPDRRLPSVFLTFLPFSDFSSSETLWSRSFIYCPFILCHSCETFSSYASFPSPKNITDQKIDATDHRSTKLTEMSQEGKHKLKHVKWSLSDPRSSMSQFVAWPTVSFPGPPRAIAYLCTARAALAALRTEDIWPIFCFSCPFMSFETQRKSQYAKLLQFSVVNFRLWSRCRHF